MSRIVFQVFYRLVVLCLFALPVLYYAMIMWPAGSDVDADRKWKLIGDAAKPYITASGLVAAIFVPVYYCGFLPQHWGWDRLMAFAIGQSVFGLGIFLPLFCIPQAATPSTKKTT